MTTETTTSPPSLSTLNLSVGGMTCASCVGRVERALKKVPGVQEATVNLARNLGLITGASVMGAVFAGATAAPDLRTAPPAALLGGMQATFGLAAGLLVLAWGVAARGRRAPA